MYTNIMHRCLSTGRNPCTNIRVRVGVSKVSRFLPFRTLPHMHLHRRLRIYIFFPAVLLGSTVAAPCVVEGRDVVRRGSNISFVNKYLKPHSLSTSWLHLKSSLWTQMYALRKKSSWILASMQTPHAYPPEKKKCFATVENDRSMLKIKMKYFFPCL